MSCDISNHDTFPTLPLWQVSDDDHQEEKYDDDDDDDNNDEGSWSSQDDDPIYRQADDITRVMTRVESDMKEIYFLSSSTSFVGSKIVSQINIHKQIYISYHDIHTISILCTMR